MKMIHQMIPNPKMLSQEYEPIKRKRVRPKKKVRTFNRTKLNKPEGF